MSDPEIEALRAVLAARPRPPGVAERRERLDALGNAYRAGGGCSSRAGERRRRAREMEHDTRF